MPLLGHKSRCFPNSRRSAVGTKLPRGAWIHNTGPCGVSLCEMATLEWACWDGLESPPLAIHPHIHLKKLTHKHLERPTHTKPRSSHKVHTTKFQIIYSYIHTHTHSQCQYNPTHSELQTQKDRNREILTHMSINSHRVSRIITILGSG